MASSAIVRAMALTPALRTRVIARTMLLRARPPGSGSRTIRRSTSGSFVGVVFNRPIDQVLTYRAPGRLRRIIQPGQRVRVPLGRGDRLAVGYCVRVETQPPADLDPARIKEVVEVLDPLPLIDRQDARADPLDG